MRIISPPIYRRNPGDGPYIEGQVIELEHESTFKWESGMKLRALAQVAISIAHDDLKGAPVESVIKVSPEGQQVGNVSGRYNVLLAQNSTLQLMETLNVLVLSPQETETSFEIITIPYFDY